MYFSRAGVFTASRTARLSTVIPDGTPITTRGRKILGKSAVALRKKIGQHFFSYLKLK